MNDVRVFKIRGRGRKQRDIINWEEELNERQREAVFYTDGPLLIIAGAGTGKTRTLVYKVAYLVSAGYRPSRIVLLTFTRKAAKEMLDRSSKLADKRCKYVQGGTFHSFALNILRRYADKIGYDKNFSVMDRGDSEDTIDYVMAKLGYKNERKRFPKKALIASTFSRSINTELPLEAIVERYYPQYKDYIEDFYKIYEEYKDLKKKSNMMDYDDLLINLRRCLLDDKIGDKIRSSFDYIMVDEFQDTNKMQGEISYLLAKDHKKITVVGDDSQSIYSFRGASFENIMNFPKLFDNTKIIMLEENYRSTNAILEFTNQIVKNMEEKYEKKLFSNISGNKKPYYVEVYDIYEQARFVVDMILELRDEGINLEDIAVLFRSSFNSNELEIELSNANIPFVKHGGRRFIEAAHIKDMLSILKIAHNPYDSMSWFRILKLISGIGTKTAQKIINIVQQSSGDISVLDRGFLGGYKELGRLNSESLDTLGNLIDTLRYIKKDKPLPDRLNVAFEFYKPIFEEIYDDYYKRMEDINSLLTISHRYKDIMTFLSEIALEPIENSQMGVVPVRPEKVMEDELLTLSTIHSAKGLEWHSVFLISMVEGIFPSKKAIYLDGAIEEERRLFYVGATRAKQNLFIVVPRTLPSRGNFFMGEFGVNHVEISRFLTEDDIYQKYCQKMIVVEEEDEEAVEEA